MKRLFAVLAMAICLAVPSQLVFAAAKGGGEVVVYNWSDYIPEDVLRDFTKETGIKVIYSTYESNEAMIAKIKLLKGKTYDVVCPSTYFIPQMIQAGLLQKLDHSKLPNMAQMDPKLMHQSFDPNNDYSVPYMWGTYGMIVNKKFAKDKIESWRDLLRPEFENRVMLSDDPRDTVGMALLATGSGPNSTDPEELERAFEFLHQVRPNVRVFDVTASKRAMVNEEAYIGAIWNGDAELAIQENEDLEFVYPKEGVVMWADNFAIVEGAANLENAYIFLNYMMRPDVALRCIEEYGYSTPNLEAVKMMEPELRDNVILNPTDKELGNSAMLDSVDSVQRMYNEYWEKLLNN